MGGGGWGGVVVDVKVEIKVYPKVSGNTPGAPIEFWGTIWWSSSSSYYKLFMVDVEGRIVVQKKD